MDTCLQYQIIEYVSVLVPSIRGVHITCTGQCGICLYILNFFEKLKNSEEYLVSNSERCKFIL